MTQSNKRKNAKNSTHHSANPGVSATSKSKSSSAARIFMMYFVIFGTILAFIGFMGDDSLPDSRFFIWLLLAMNFIISIIATISHTKSGKKSKIDEIAGKW